MGVAPVSSQQYTSSPVRICSQLSRYLLPRDIPIDHLLYPQNIQQLPLLSPIRSKRDVILPDYQPSRALLLMLQKKILGWDLYHKSA